MQRTLKTRRGRMATLVALVAVGTALSACGSPPPTDTSTRWLAAGCIDSAVPGIPDFQFTGVANTANNANGFATDDLEPPTLSDDGTCTGTPTDYSSVVRSTDAAGAAGICTGLGLSVVNPPRLVDFGYAAPLDAWACIEAPA